jgi:uridine phosphorylase
MISTTDLILNKDGSIYHLGLLPEQVCDNIILVGDPDRLKLFKPKFERIFYTHHTREFHSMMGEINGKEVMVVSTGIGTDNIDIVINELDALANIDFEKREPLKKKKVLNFYRIGTSGTIQKDIEVDSLLISTHGIGLDVLMHYYDHVPSSEEALISKDIQAILKKNKIGAPIYTATCSPKLLKKFGSHGMLKGMTVTLPGFYGPQGRSIRAQPKSFNLLDDLANYHNGKMMITNLEMETAGIYGLASLLGHNAISFNAILANRVSHTFSNKPKDTVKSLIEKVLAII